MHRYYNEGPDERQFNIAHLRMGIAEKTISLGDALFALTPATVRDTHCSYCRAPHSAGHRTPRPLLSRGMCSTQFAFRATRALISEAAMSIASASGATVGTAGAGICFTPRWVSAYSTSSTRLQTPNLS